MNEGQIAPLIAFIFQTAMTLKTTTGLKTFTVIASFLNPGTRAGLIDSVANQD